MRHRRKAVLVAAMLVVTLLPLAGSGPPATAVPNPVATDPATYAAFGRVFPDPQGCLNEVGAALPKGVSPWAKGNVCAVQFLQYEEVFQGAQFLERMFPDFLEIQRLDQAYKNGEYRSAGIPRAVAIDDGNVEIMSRDRRPLYMFKVTDETSNIPERDRLHFVYALSIHGIERAGLEGGARAMEDLVTWAACERNDDVSPVCGAEGIVEGEGKSIIETDTERPAPTAGEALRNSVIYFTLNNPDGWARGEVSPAQTEQGAPNANHRPGVFFQRYNGNGVDLNRDWPSIGYTFKPYSPWSEPETRAFGEVLRNVRDNILGGEAFAGGIDLHGMITAYAFSYTLLGAGQRDYRKNALSVETSIRAWEDQTQRLAWSPYVADPDPNTEGGEDQFPCLGRGTPVPLVFEGGTRGRVPACVADQWGTVIDTIGYQITGGLGDWIDNDIGLDAVGIDNEMYTSHIAPNTVFEPALEQTHIDGNKGLIYSQIAAMMTASEPSLSPGGNVGYVYNPNRLEVSPEQRPQNPGLPAQNDIEVVVPCQNQVQAQLEPAGCKQNAEFLMDGSNPTLEFSVHGPEQKVWNGGITVTVTRPNVSGISDGHIDQNNLRAHIQLQHLEEGQWHPVATDFNQSPVYLQAGQIVTVNDPAPCERGENGEVERCWRVWFERPQQLPARVEIDFDPVEAERDPGQVAINASSMDFFPEQNRYVRKGEELQAVAVRDVATNPAALEGFDTIVLVNRIGSPAYIRSQFGLSKLEARDFFANLRAWVRGGGNLVLTDAALQAVPKLNKEISQRDVRSDVPFAFSSPGDRTLDHAPAGSYFFKVGDVITYEHPDQYPLARDVDKPGAAELEPGRRQAAEPTPLGYTPDPDYDPDPAMPVWGIDRQAWEGPRPGRKGGAERAACGVPNCVTALSNPIDTNPDPKVTEREQHVSIGEMKIGQGTVRIAGVMFPDPVFDPDEANDHRFGVADYALTYTAFDVFENLIDPNL